MFDIELYLCIVPVSPELLELVERVLAATYDDRPRLSAALLDLAHAELAGAHLRWTPHYDAALRVLLEAGDGLYDYVDPEAYACGVQRDFALEVRSHLTRHAATCQLLAEAMEYGSHTLGDAFDAIAIGTKDLESWFMLVPDTAALITRIHDALIAQLRATTDDSKAPITEDVLIAAVRGGFSHERIAQFRAAWHDHPQDLDRRCVVDALTASSPSRLWSSLRDVPLEVFARLGNPFRPHVAWT